MATKQSAHRENMHSFNWNLPCVSRILSWYSWIANCYKINTFWSKSAPLNVRVLTLLEHQVVRTGLAAVIFLSFFHSMVAPVWCYHWERKRYARYGRTGWADGQAFQISSNHSTPMQRKDSNLVRPGPPQFCTGMNNDYQETVWYWSGLGYKYIPNTK